MAGKASGTGSPRGRRIRSACSADRFTLVVLCVSSPAFWTNYHGARAGVLLPHPLVGHGESFLGRHGFSR